MLYHSVLLFLNKLISYIIVIGVYVFVVINWKTMDTLYNLIGGLLLIILSGFHLSKGNYLRKTWFFQVFWRQAIIAGIGMLFLYIMEIFI